MSFGSDRIAGLYRLIKVGVLGAVVGLLVAALANPLPIRSRTRYIPAAYRLPKIPGGTPLRMAMAHDVLHERYLRHGGAWYARRNDDARKTIAAEEAAKPAEPSARYLDALDDLAIGLEAVGDRGQSAAVLRKKLATLPRITVTPATRPTSAPTGARPRSYDFDLAELQRILSAQHLSQTEHHQYTACANLGTVLIHSAMPKALAGDPSAKAVVREGLEYLRTAIAINPGAHFGRENWQAIIVEHLLAAIDHPELLTTFDAIGQTIDDERPHLHLYASWRNLLPASPTPGERVDFRSELPRTGVDAEWAAIVHPDYPIPMPFDEPTLAIIGMWTLGGGPSPHFALALARIMEGLAQNEIAWNAYERAVELQDRFWPDAAARAKFIAYCRSRQTAIAEREAPGGPETWQDRLRRVHSSELAWGEAYQKAYEDFEAAQIVAGVPPDAPNFYDPFFANRPSIASSPGLADEVAVTRLQATEFLDMLPCMLVGAGSCMLLATRFPSRHRNNAGRV